MILRCHVNLRKTSALLRNAAIHVSGLQSVYQCLSNASLSLSIFHSVYSVLHLMFHLNVSLPPSMFHLVLHSLLRYTRFRSALARLIKMPIGLSINIHLPLNRNEQQQYSDIKHVAN